MQGSESQKKFLGMAESKGGVKALKSPWGSMTPPSAGSPPPEMSAPASSPAMSMPAPASNGGDNQENIMHQRPDKAGKEVNSVADLKKALKAYSAK